jgi:predicted DNA-binding protein with PD1-like motif
MKYAFDGSSYVLVFKKGEEVISRLLKFIEETDIQSAWISGLGGALEVELGYYDLDKRAYQWGNFVQVSEIAALQGNIARDDAGKPVVHMHGVFGDEGYQTAAGHVNRLVAGGTCELFLHPFDRPLKRTFDDETGLKLLDLEQS